MNVVVQGLVAGVHLAGPAARQLRAELGQVRLHIGRIGFQLPPPGVLLVQGRLQLAQGLFTVLHQRQHPGLDPLVPARVLGHIDGASQAKLDGGEQLQPLVGLAGHARLPPLTRQTRGRSGQVLPQEVRAQVRWRCPLKAIV